MRYEYNIEDIRDAEITSTSSDQYSTLYNRIGDTTKFLQTFYSADTYEYDEDGIGSLDFICKRCGESTTIPVSFDTSADPVKVIGDPEYICSHCMDDFEIIVDESEVKDALLESFADEGVTIVINGEGLIK